MRVNVLKAFPMAAEGGKTANVPVGEQDIPEGLVASLIADGYIERPEGHEPVPMTGRRRDEIISRAVALTRRQLEAAPDEHLEEVERQINRHLAEQAEHHDEADRTEASEGGDAASSARPAEGQSPAAEPISPESALAAEAAQRGHGPDHANPLDHDNKDGAGGSVAETSPEPFDEMEDDELRDFIGKRDGVKPHHRTGRDRLLEIARKA